MISKKKKKERKKSMQVLHEYLILFTVKYFSDASTRLVEMVLTLGLLTRHSIIYLFIYPHKL